MVTAGSRRAGVAIVAEDDVKRTIEALPDEALLWILDADADEYTSFAISVAAEEAARRGGRVALRARVGGPHQTHAGTRRRRRRPITLDGPSLAWALVGFVGGGWMLFPFGGFLMCFASLTIGLAALWPSGARRSAMWMAALWTGFMVVPLWVLLRMAVSYLHL